MFRPRIVAAALAVVLLVVGLATAAWLLVEISSSASFLPTHLCTGATGDACTLRAAGPFGFPWVGRVVDLVGVAATVGPAVVLLRAAASHRRRTRPARRPAGS